MRPAAALVIAIVMHFGSRAILAQAILAQGSRLLAVFCPAEKSWLPKPNGSWLLKKNFKVKLLALCIDVCTEIP